MDRKFVALMIAFLVGVSAKPASEFDPSDVESIDVGKGPLSFLPHFPTFNAWSFPDLDSIQAMIDNIRKSIFGSLGDIDLSKGNTTSKTQIIDGNVVTVNTTEIDQNGTKIVIKKVDVHPVGATSGPSGNPNPTNTAGPQTGTSTANNELESFEDSSNNERLRPIYDNLETFDNAAFDMRHRYNVDNIQEVMGNHIDNNRDYDRQLPFDLNRDIFINEWAAAQGFPRNPDAEDIEPPSFRGGNYIRPRFL